MTKKENLQDIYDKLFVLLAYFQNNLCSKNLNLVPSGIQNAIIGNNKLPSMINGTIQEVTEDELYGVKVIDTFFYDCQNLTSITIPDTVTTINYLAFNGCRSLADIYFKSTTPPSIYKASDIPTITTIHVPIGSGEAYKSATNWSDLASRIIEDIEI